jgi:ribosomal protein L35
MTRYKRWKISNKNKIKNKSNFMYHLKLKKDRI